jgi:rubrerythrin
MKKGTAITTETIENLLAAYSGERNATARYIAFAVQAEKENFHGVASLFRAVAHSEQVHATNHARVLRHYNADLEFTFHPIEVGTTNANLSVALQGEQVERDQMYPQFSEQAAKDGCREAVDSFDSACEVESIHAMMFSAALESLEDYRERTTYYGCSVCGWISSGPNFKRCVLCNAPKERFDRIE